MTSLYNLFQNISRIINYKSKSDKIFKDNLIYKSEDYNMNQNSFFLDIGSGFGKPVFHTAFQVGCYSKGIEVVPARVEFCMDFYYENFEGGKSLLEEVDNKIYKKNSKNKEDSDDEATVNETNVKIPQEKLSQLIQPKHTKFKIYHNENTTSFVDCEINFVNKINLNEINQNYIFDVLFRNSNRLNYFPVNSYNGYIELKINNDLASDNNYAQFLKENIKLQKSILVEDNTPIYDTDNIFNSYLPFLKFDKFFILENFTNEITPINDYLNSNLINTLLNFTFYDKIEREIFLNLNMMKNEKFRKVNDLVQKIENVSILNFVLFVLNIFVGKKSYYDFFQVQNNYSKINKNINISTNLPKDFYEQLKEELKNRENLILEQQQKENEDKIISQDFEDENIILKEVLTNLKFKNYDKNWYENVKFVSEDATIHNQFKTENGNHFTHIYAYNKLMSKECRSKIAKILNKTKYKILAWYSNPKQTKKAGLKNFTLLAKFPMQSTSTEKFHVYVYIKTK